MRTTISLLLALGFFTVGAQTTTFDNLNANPLTNKAITWTSSNYGSGFGHRIVNSDPGGYTLLDIQGRHNSYTWLSILSVTSDRKVGIGTTAPTEKLHVAGNIRANELKLNDPITVTDWNSIWQSGFYESHNASNAPENGVWFWGLSMNHGSNNSSYRYNGQIAIKNATTSPTMYFRSTNSNGVGTWAKVLHSVGNQYIIGNLGIGTTSPDSELAVNGNIHAKEVKVDLIGWSDYVFHDDYDLPTLEEVEQHIKDKGHLINIPSAKEVEEDGVQLGEMNMKFLEKIEELTLYVIELEKKNKNYEERFSKIESELKSKK